MSTEPFMSAAKVDNYRSHSGAAAYLADHQKKAHRIVSDSRERKILRQMLAGAATSRRCSTCRAVSDACWTCSARAGEVVEADYSPSMLALNRELHGESAAQFLECPGARHPRQRRQLRRHRLDPAQPLPRDRSRAPAAHPRAVSRVPRPRRDDLLLGIESSRTGSGSCAGCGTASGPRTP